jgi:hypothetical protein
MGMCEDDMGCCCCLVHLNNKASGYGRRLRVASDGPTLHFTIPKPPQVLTHPQPSTCRPALPIHYWKIRTNISTKTA